MRKEDYVTKECARLAQQKGFPLQKVYKDNGDRPLFYDLPKEHPDWMHCDAWYYPTLWEVQQWLIEEKGISVETWWSFDFQKNSDCFRFVVKDMKWTEDSHTILDGYPTMPKALQTGIMEALKLFKL